MVSPAAATPHYHSIVKGHAFHPKKNLDGCHLWCVAAKAQFGCAWTPFKYAVSVLRNFCSDENDGDLTLTLEKARHELCINRVLTQRFEVAIKNLATEKTHSRLKEIMIDGQKTKPDKDQRALFLKECAKQLSTLQVRFDAIFNTKNTHFRKAATNVTKAQFINELNLATSNFERTEAFLTQYSDPNDTVSGESSTGSNIEDA